MKIEQIQRSIEDLKTKKYKTAIVYNYLESDKEKVVCELKRGVVIKIDSFYQEGRDYHNYWGVILSYNSNDNEYRVAVQVFERLTVIVYLKYENIKKVIGTLEMDCVGIGVERHKKEVIPLINKVINY